jgi:hypothetical protein
MLGMLSMICTIDEKIIYICYNKSVHVFHKGFVHVSLECYRAISKAKEEDFILIGSKSCFESSKVFILFCLHSNLIKSMTDVNFSKVFCSYDLYKHLVN